MNRKYCVLALAVVLLLAGCSGDNTATTEPPDGAGTSTPTTEPPDGAGTTTSTTEPPDGTVIATQSAESTGEPKTTREAIADEHPAVTDGTLNISSLVRDHGTVLRSLESITVLNNRTVTYVENDSVNFRSDLVNKIDLANQRQRLEQLVFTPDGDILDKLVRFSNGTTTCTLRNDEYDCSSSGVSTRKLIGSTMETTSLETVGAPNFHPNGIVEEEGQSLYRYSASSFRPSMDASIESELFGEDPTLGEATLLVHPSGRIVEYSLTYQTGGETPQELGLTYVTTAVNSTTIEPLNRPEREEPTS